MSLYAPGSIPTSFKLIASRNKFGIYFCHGRGYIVCRLPSRRGSTEFTPSSALTPFPTLESAETALKKWAAAPQPPRPPRKPKAALGACRRNGHPPKFRGDGTGQMFLNLELPKRKDPAPRSVNPDRVLRSFSDEEANKD